MKPYSKNTQMKVSKKVLLNQIKLKLVLKITVIIIFHIK